MSTDVNNGAKKVPAPPFASELSAMLAEKSVFLMTGNVRDLVAPGMMLRSYLTRVFRKSWDLFAWYNRATGISFGTNTPSEQEVQSKLFNAIISGTATEKGTEAVEETGEPVVEYVPAVAAVKMSAAARTSVGAADAQVDPSKLRHPEQALVALDRVLRTPATIAKSVVVVDYADLLVPRGDAAQMAPADRDTLVMIREWAADAQIRAAGHVVLLIAENIEDVHPMLRSVSSRIAQIDLPVPTYDERLAFVDALGDAGIEMAIERDEYARLTAGLTRLLIEDIALRSKRLGQPVSRDLCIERSRKLISQEYGGMVEFIDPDHGLADVGGLSHVKRTMNEVVAQLADGDPNTPLQVLFSGPPGTGKTFVADATARDAGAIAFRFDPSACLGGIVGESEGKFGKVLRMFESLGRCVIFVDEIDQAFARGTEGDPVGPHIFKMWLEFTCRKEHRGRILIISATNRPDQIDAAQKRDGRIDLKVPFLPPSDTDRVEILDRLAIRFLGGPVDVASIALTTDGWTPAELETLARKAAKVVKQERATRENALPFAMTRIVSTTKDVRHQTLLALAEINDLDVLPDDYQDAARDRDRLQADLATIEAPVARTAQEHARLDLD